MERETKMGRKEKKCMILGFGVERFVALLLASLTPGHITADKRLRCTSPKLPLAASFIRKTLSEMPRLFIKNRNRR